MRTKTFFLSSILFTALYSQAQIYMGKSCEISFFSETRMENISAKNITAKPILNTTTNDIAVKVTIKGFDFESELMEEHFNEKYMESDKLPSSTFAGKIKDTIDYKKDGIHKVSVVGKLTLHGVEKERTISGTLTVKGGEISFESKFAVALADHNITVPPINIANIAEKIDVVIKSTLVEYKTKK